MENKTTPKTKGIDYSNKILEVKNLKTHFKVGTGKNKIKIKAVDGISIDIYKRDVFGLVGESGCGKTTASRTIMRLYRPTAGEIKFEDTIIGSGDNDFYDNLKRERVEYRISKLKLNSRKSALHDIDQKYKKLFYNHIREELALQKEFDEQKSRVNQPIEQHKKTIYEAKTNYNLIKERAHYDFNLKKENIFKETINEESLEFESIKKSLAKSFKIKLGSLDDSVGLNKETREHQKEILRKVYENDLLELEAEYKDKIVDKSERLLPKSEYKTRVKVLEKEAKKNIIEITNQRKAYLKEMVKPEYKEIKAKLAQLIETHKEKKKAIKAKKRELRKLRLSEVKVVDKKLNIDHEKLAELKLSHQRYMEEQREGIRASRDKHFAKTAIEQTRKMQMIFQDPISSLNPRMTVGEIVSEGLVIKGEKNKEVLKEKVIEALNLVGLAPEYITRYPHEFSGGQRQRIGIARALIMNPSFIIADEPISALDVSIRAQVLNLLTGLKEKLDLSILFIAHDLSVVKFFCDRIAVMYAGKIVELAPTNEIFTKPLHAYTRSLLSAIPQPDPDSEKLRKRIPYYPGKHDYSKDKPELREIYKGHFVYCNKAELNDIKKELGDVNA